MYWFTFGRGLFIRVKWAILWLMFSALSNPRGAAVGVGTLTKNVVKTKQRTGGEFLLGFSHSTITSTAFHM